MTLPLRRFAVYWCDSHMGIHISGHSGELNGHRMQPVEVVRADLYDRAVAALRAIVDMTVVDGNIDVAQDFAESALGELEEKP